MGGTVLLLIVIGTVVAALWLRGTEGGSLLLEQVLRRQSDDVAGRALASGSRDFALAVQRCLACTQAAECRAWLGSGARQGYESFCPNTGYIARLKM